jgi:hypothetical protein
MTRSNAYRLLCEIEDLFTLDPLSRLLDRSYSQVPRSPLIGMWPSGLRCKRRTYKHSCLDPRIPRREPIRDR